MIKDYSVYELSGKEKLLFYFGGVCVHIHHHVSVLSQSVAVRAGGRGGALDRAVFQQAHGTAQDE